MQAWSGCRVRHPCNSPGCLRRAPFQAPERRIKTYPLQGTLQIMLCVHLSVAEDKPRSRSSFRGALPKNPVDRERTRLCLGSQSMPGQFTQVFETLGTIVRRLTALSRSSSQDADDLTVVPRQISQTRPIHFKPHGIFRCCQVLKICGYLRAVHNRYIARASLVSAPQCLISKISHSNDKMMH